jgi:aminoglycoside phosphotransferase (APT) family kinase protein
MIPPEAQARLCEWLAREAGAERVAIDNIAMLGGGAISQNIALDIVIEGGSRAGRHECVLRAASPAGVAASLTKPQEFAVLRAGFEAGMAAPEPLFLCDGAAVFGRPFYIMRRARGIAAGRLITKSETPKPGLTRELGRQLALLHGIRLGAPGLDFLPIPESPGLAAARLYRQWLGAEASRDPVIAWGLRWLERNALPPGEIVLCHHDFRTGNYLVDGGELTAILDWEFCGWSDPMEDVAWFCCRSWRFARPDLEAGGIGSRADFYDAYQEASGRYVDPARIAFWETSAYLRWAAIAWLQAERHTSGVEPSLEMALTGRMIPEILNDMLIHLEDVEGRRG